MIQQLPPTDYDQELPEYTAPYDPTPYEVIAQDWIKALYTSFQRAAAIQAQSYEQFAKALQTFAQSYEEVTTKLERKAPVRNHGPRPATTFDRRGNRRY